MVFSNLLFVFLFLVLSLFAYLCGPTTRAKNIILLASSLIFYTWGGPLLVLLLCGVTLLCYVGALRIQAAQAKGARKRRLAVTVVLCLLPLIFFKYTVFLLKNVQALTGFPETLPSILLPIGISFYTFQLISYVVDVYRGEVEAQRTYWKLLLYVSLFHQCIAGPIVRYADVCREIDNRTVSLQEISRGMTRFAVGLAKKAILANYCGLLADTLLPYSAETLSGQSALSLILGAICFTLHIYLDFSAYSDMAIGMGLMVGFHYRENFFYPYVAVSITDFWRRWHMSLSFFFRDYVYIPLGGNRCSVPRHILNLSVVWLLTGFWHGADWNFILWGLYYLVFLLLEKFVFRLGKDDRPRGIVRILRHVYVLPVILIGWMLFRFNDLSQFWIVLKGFVCANGNSFTDLTAGLAFRNNLFFLLVACVACTPIIPYLHHRLTAWINQSQARVKEGETSLAGLVYPILCGVLPAVCILLSLLSLVGDSYNPFLYFNF